MSVWDSPGKEYRIRYLEPPWRLLMSETTTATFQIDPSFARVDAGVPAKYLLVTTVEPGTARARADEDVAMAGPRREMVIVPPRAVTTDSGDTGFEVLTHTMVVPEYPRNLRYVTLDSTRGGNVVRLVFQANPSVDDPEVDAMIRAADVAPGTP